MRHQLVAKAITITIFAVAFGLYVHRDNVKWSQLGREAFIDYQLKDFDSDKAEPTPAATMIIACLLLSFAFFGFYELISFLFAAALKRLFPPPPPIPSVPTYPFI